RQERLDRSFALRVRYLRLYLAQSALRVDLQSQSIGKRGAQFRVRGVISKRGSLPDGRRLYLFRGDAAQASQQVALLGYRDERGTMYLHDPLTEFPIQAGEGRDEHLRPGLTHKRLTEKVNARGFKSHGEIRERSLFTEGPIPLAGFLHAPDPIPITEL